MRFDKEIRTAIHDAAPEPVTIVWPEKAPEPQIGRVYWLQSAEQAKADKERREESPDTCAEVLASMAVRAGKTVAPPKRRRRRSTRPHAGLPRIYVIDAAVLGEHDWEVKVALYEEFDPVRHLQIKTKEPVEQNAMGGPQFRTRTEPEQIPPEPTYQSRREEEEALAIEHKGSLDRAAVLKAEQHLAKLRKRGKRSKLAEEAVVRAKRREAEKSAAGGD